MSEPSAREAAARALLAVERGGYSNLVLSRALGGISLERDRRFASALASGALERLLTLDYALETCLSKPLVSLDGEVRAILRSGLYQCLFMDGVPARAAVSESVKLCRSMSKSSASSLVNAVLRKAAAFDLAQIDNIKDERERLSVKYSLCAPLVGMIERQYGDSAEGVMAAFFSKPRDAARVNTLRTSSVALLGELQKEGVEARECEIPDALELLGGWSGGSALARGDMRVQSLSAQRAALALDAKPGQRALDMCAAPGGKTLTTAQLMRNEGEIIALDRSAKRLALLERQAALEGVSIIKTLSADAREYGDAKGFDRVLCDVPCSGYGETAAKPELRYKSPEGNGELYAIQRAILENGARLLKKGGRLVYSTCTIDERENELVAEEFLKNHADFEPVATDGGAKYTKIIPGESDPEGFFIATFLKVC